MKSFGWLALVRRVEEGVRVLARGAGRGGFVRGQNALKQVKHYVQQCTGKCTTHHVCMSRGYVFPCHAFLFSRPLNVFQNGCEPGKRLKCDPIHSYVTMQRVYVAPLLAIYLHQPEMKELRFLLLSSRLYNVIHCPI